MLVAYIYISLYNIYIYIAFDLCIYTPCFVTAGWNFKPDKLSSPVTESVVTLFSQAARPMFIWSGIRFLRHVSCINISSFRFSCTLGFVTAGGISTGVKLLSPVAESVATLYAQLFCFFLFFFFFLIHFVTPFGKFGPPYLGKATAAVRAALSIPTRVCDVLVFTCVRLQQPQDQRYPVLQVHLGLFVFP